MRSIGSGRPSRLRRSLGLACVAYCSSNVLAHLVEIVDHVLRNAARIGFPVSLTVPAYNPEIAAIESLFLRVAHPFYLVALCRQRRGKTNYTAHINHQPSQSS